MTSQAFFQDVKKFAALSPCLRYRYVLIREWSPKPKLAWIMLNPSTADDKRDDPTIRVCIGRALRMNAGGIIVVNLFALRATNPEALWKASDPVGPSNDKYIQREIIDRPFDFKPLAVIAAWGNYGDFLGRDKVVRSMLAKHKVYLHNLGLTGDGHPRHPLRIPYTYQPQMWSH